MAKQCESRQKDDQTQYKTGAEKDMITEEGTYKLSMVSTPIRIGQTMLKMFIIHFKYIYISYVN